MQDRHVDIAIAGAGLSASLTALRLAREARVLVIDRRAQPRAGHTWSFHERDVSPHDREWLAPAIRTEWTAQEVRFPSYRRMLRSGYAALDADSLGAALAALPNVASLHGEVQALDGRGVTLRDGRRIGAQVAIDARGFRPDPALDIRFQKFLGLELELARPHGLAGPVIMDATVPQRDGYRFFYLLPFDPTRVLVEATHYSDGAGLPAERLRAEVLDYAQGKGWEIAKAIREESGVLPIALRFDAERFWRETPADAPRLGLRAGRFHPLTGYSLPQAARGAEIVARHWRGGPEALAAMLRKDSLRDAREQSFYRLLARLLFEAAEPDQRRRVMERFYRLPEPLIERLYAGESSLVDKARILTGRPPVPVLRALRCLPGRLRKRSA